MRRRMPGERDREPRPLWLKSDRKSLAPGLQVWRNWHEEGKRKQLAAGVLGLDMYNMREPLKKAGLIDLDDPLSD